MLVLAVAIDLDELFENRGLASVALLCELSGIVVVTVYTAIVLVIAVLGSEYGVAQGTGEVVDVILAV